MRAIPDMDTIQIEVTNYCHRDCSNCTRFCGHGQNFMMDFEFFKHAVDCSKDHPKMIGMMGGEPLLHPKFEQMCDYMRSLIPRQRLGLWTSLPEGKEHYAELICETFDNIFINDHTREDIYHAPLLVGVQEIYTNPRQMWYVIDKCWLQNAWSASINPRGAFFCEIAASMSYLYDIDCSWPVEPEWWMRVPFHYWEQVQRYCPQCGACVPLPRRVSNDGRDDISPKNLELLKDRSKKVKKGEYVLSSLKLVKQPEPMASYKDHDWRNQVARRYGMYLTINQLRFWSPHMITGPIPETPNIFNELKRRYENGRMGRDCRIGIS